MCLDSSEIDVRHQGVLEVDESTEDRRSLLAGVKQPGDLENDDIAAMIIYSVEEL